MSSTTCPSKVYWMIFLTAICLAMPGLAAGQETTSSPQTARGETEDSTTELSIAVVDMEWIWGHYAPQQQEWLGIQEQLAAHANKMEAFLQTNRHKLGEGWGHCRTSSTSLGKYSRHLTADRPRCERQWIQLRIEALRLDRNRRAIEARSRARVRRVAGEYAERHRIALVLHHAGRTRTEEERYQDEKSLEKVFFVYSDPALDISEAVLAELNKAAN